MKNACGVRVLVLLTSVWFGAATAELSLADGRLRCDALVAASSHFWRKQQGGLARNEFVFEQGTAVVGVTGLVSSEVAFRASCDLAVLRPQDAFVDVESQSGLGLRAGQFQMPLGVDLMTNPVYAKLPGHPLMAAYAVPVEPWDIGIMGEWSSDRGYAAFAVVNGSGPNALDNNDRKDFCCRAGFRPWLRQDIEFAARGYYGWPDTATVAWRTIGAEFFYRGGRASVQAELQNLSSARLANNSGYAQFAYDLGIFEPVGRIEAVLPMRQRVDFSAMAGVNVRTPGDRVKVMLDVGYRIDTHIGWSLIGFTLRLQAVM